MPRPRAEPHSQFIVRNVPRNLKSSPLPHDWDSVRLTPRELSSAVHVGSSDDAWQAMGRRVAATQELRVAVLGSSVTSGCGSSSPNPYCKIETSWPRFMHERLLSAASAGRIRTNVHAKNAVPINYFYHCTEGMVPEDTDVVLLEQQMNMYEWQTHAAQCALCLVVLRSTTARPGGRRNATLRPCTPASTR